MITQVLVINTPKGKFDVPAKIQFIREWRKHAGLTQVQLAERIGISRGQLSKNETGMRIIDLDILAKMATIFGCRPFEILARDPKETEDIWSIWCSLDAHEQRQAIQMLRALKIR